MSLKILIKKLYYSLRFFGRDIIVDPSAFISRKSVLKTVGGGKIRIGKNCEIHDFAMVLTYGGDVYMGDYCSLNPFSILYGHGGVNFGKGVRIAAHCTIIPANHNRGSENVPLYRSGISLKGISIGDNSWIVSGCRILDGVDIGNNVIIGAGSVVTKDIPAFSIAYGVPAKVPHKQNL